MAIERKSADHVCEFQLSPVVAPLSRASSPYSLQRPKDRQDAGVSDQQYRATSAGDCHTVRRTGWAWSSFFLRVKRFQGTNETAVKSQIWCAVATYVLIEIVKKQLNLEASLYP
jgi:hypothetical protein